MNKIFLSLLFCGVVIHQSGSAQKITHEAGFFLGTSFYMGDINPTRVFYAPSLAFGALYKMNITDMQSLRVQVNYGEIKGNDKDFNNAYQQYRGASFSASLIDINLNYEFNFLPLQYKERKTTFSPFIFGGVGLDLPLKSPGGVPGHPSLPFGAGLKYLPAKNITMGVEWSFRKTFIDNIDGVLNPGNNIDKSLINNTDWYSFAGFFITFRLFDNSNDCPAYK